jgi:O-antigen/teichoic acid export membrane protein
MTDLDRRAAFFRQSGWLMIANFASGGLMWAVHLLSHVTGPAEYGLFVTYVGVAMCIPTASVQMVMAQQTAKALATNRPGELTGLTRMVWLGTFLLQKHILARWNVSNSAGLWVTVLTLLFALWMPLFQGVLQGQQNFLWLGWSAMSQSIGRLGVAALAVLVFGGLAAGMMTGVLAGMIAVNVIAIWQTRSVWSAPARAFDWRSLLRQILPLMIAATVVQFLFMADIILVKAYFPSGQVGFYDSAGTLSRALMWLVLPLATVMFPRIVHSSAKAEKTNLLGLVFAGTAVLSIAGALGLSLLGPLVILIVNGKDFVKATAPLLPWYAGAMVPLCLANVLINALLARSSFRIVPWLCILALGYFLALTQFHATLVMVLKTLGIANLFLLALSGWFTWMDTKDGLTLENRTPQSASTGPQGRA